MLLNRSLGSYTDDTDLALHVCRTGVDSHLRDRADAQFQNTHGGSIVAAPITTNIIWFHILNMASVSYTSNLPQGDIGNHSGLHIYVYIQINRYIYIYTYFYCWAVESRRSFRSHRLLETKWIHPCSSLQHAWFRGVALWSEAKVWTQKVWKMTSQSKKPVRGPSPRRDLTIIINFCYL